MNARYYRSGRWVLAYATNLCGVFTQGRTLAEARLNLLDALDLQLEDGLERLLKRRTPPPRLPVAREEVFYVRIA